MRVKSTEWYIQHFSQYLDDNNKPYVMTTGSGRFTGTKHDHILNPWDYAPGGWGQLNIYGYKPFRYTDKPSWWPWVKKLYVSEDVYFQFLASLNWWTNGNTTMSNQKIGLDPSELFGGHRGVDQDVFTCVNGIYTPRSLRYGNPAHFQWTKGPKQGEHWFGDDIVNPYIPQHGND